MSRARRQPPLFEFLGEPSRRPTPPASSGPAVSSAPVAAGVRTPVEVQGPKIRLAQVEELVDESGLDEGASLPKPTAPRQIIRTWAIAASAGVLLIVGALYWGYQQGRNDEQAKLEPYMRGMENQGQPPAAALPAAMTPGPTSEDHSKGPDGFKVGDPAPGTASNESQTPPVATKFGVESRRTGMNYLELCTLTYRDGLQAVEFLEKNGVKAGLAPAQRGVDPGKTAANNGPHVVFVLEGVASDRFKASEKERAQLETRIKLLGKRFEREQKGASNFDRPMWRLFRDK